MTQREEFEAWWEEFCSAHEDWRFADSDALRWAAWQAAQAAQPAPRRLTEAEITLLVEAYYADVGSAPPDLIRQVEGLIFGVAQPAHHIEQDLKTVQPAQVPGWLPIESAPATANNVLAFSASGNMSIQTGHCLRNMLHAAKVDGDLCNYTHWMPLPAAPSHSRMDRILDRQRNDRDKAMSVLSAAPSPKEGQPEQPTQVAKEDIAAAWIAGYYHAGYTNDGAYADKMSDEFAAEWAAAPSTKEGQP